MPRTQSEALIFCLLLVVLLVNRSVDDLNDLNDGNDKNCKTECDTVLSKIKVCKLKCICKRF